MNREPEHDAPPRLLLVEDDEALGAQVAELLRGDGYEVVWLTRGDDAMRASPEGFQLAVLDLTLPGASGLEVLRVLRAQSDVPVLVLSARNEAGEKVRALELGADDFVTKPFWPDELVARVRACMRRPLLQRVDDVRVGPIRIDPIARRVAVAGTPVELTNAEFGILAALARRPGAAIERGWLARRVLDRDDTRGLDAHVSRLRRKLGDAAACIVTVWGVGYRLEEGGNR